MTDLLLVYITCASFAEARMIGRALVEENLAACVNLRPHHAIYRWRGEVEEAEETGLLAKTHRTALPQLQARVQALHSHDVPCLITLPITGGLPAYLEWLES